MFAGDTSTNYLRGFLKAMETISKEMRQWPSLDVEKDDVDAQVLGATWDRARGPCPVHEAMMGGHKLHRELLDAGLLLVR